MDDLHTKLDQLEDSENDYVFERSKVIRDSEGYRGAGIPKASFYKWTRERRDYLNELAQALKRETSYRAHKILQDAAEEAARVKVDGLKSRNEHVKQGASTEILDRQLGRATQRTEISGKGGGPVILEWPE